MDFAVHIEHVGEGLENEEGKSKRQHNLRPPKCPHAKGLEHPVEIVDEEVAVLEAGQQAQVQSHRCPKQALPPTFVPGFRQPFYQMKIEEGGEQHHKDELRRSPSIKHHTPKEDDQVFVAVVGKGVQPQKQWEEPSQEEGGAEYHQFSVAGCQTGTQVRQMPPHGNSSFGSGYPQEAKWNWQAPDAEPTMQPPIKRAKPCTGKAVEIAFSWGLFSLIVLI